MSQTKYNTHYRISNTAIVKSLQNINIFDVRLSNMTVKKYGANSVSSTVICNLMYF